MCTIIEEEWRDIAGYEGLYQVSNLGRVKSLNYRHTGKGKILKPDKNKYGYLQVTLYKNGKYNRRFVHRLVARMFIPNHKNLPQINHKDENKENNRIDNLEWCDAKYNINYGTRNERAAKSLLNNKYRSKPVLCVETGKVFSSAMEAERKTGADHSNITKCCRGELIRTKHLHWQYVD